MSTWLIVSLVLHSVYVFTPAMLFLPAEGIGTHLGGRDQLPEPSPTVGRARRALANWQESFPAFLALAVAALATGAHAQSGAVLFLTARLAYLPLYLGGVPYARSAAWMASVAGLVWMAWAIL